MKPERYGMSKSNHLQSVTLLAIFATFVFAICMYYFIAMHPIQLYDTDDWLYISYDRLPIPLPGDWNPTRVFPEVFLPLCSSFAVKVIGVITGDWYSAITYMNALVASLFITIYIFMFERMVETKSRLKRSYCICIATIFLSLHFIIQPEGHNLFWSVDMTSFYYYTVSNLLCASLTLWLMQRGTLDGVFMHLNPFCKILIVVILYFALLSNLFSSVILEAWIFCTLVSGWLRLRRNQGFSKAGYLKKSIMQLLFSVLWVVVQLLEVTGSRSASLGSKSSGFLPSLCEVFSLLASNPVWIGCISLFIVLLIVFVVSGNRKQLSSTRKLPRMTLLSISSGTLTGIYLILVCSKSITWYITRADVYFGIFFFALIALTPLACRLVFNMLHRGGSQLITISAGLFVALMIASWPFSEESNVGNASPQDEENISRDIASQVIEATNRGEQNIEIVVPKFSSSDNWPIASYSAQRFPHALYSLGIIDYEPIASLIIDEQEN